MTIKLYLENIEAAYAQSFDARVVEVDNDRVVLDRTLFYPLGGGQHWDTGTLSGPNGDVPVTEVRGRGDVHHTVGPEHQLQIGDEVRGTIDWATRYAHMRMHTAQHLVSGLAYEMFDGVRTVGNQIHADRSRIDFNPISFDETMLNDLLAAANDRIDSGLEVSDNVMTRGEINAIMPPERTNMDLLPISVKQLRIVQIGDRVDMCPCAGTHVSNIAELGHIELLGKKSKGKGHNAFPTGSTHRHLFALRRQMSFERIIRSLLFLVRFLPSQHTQGPPMQTESLFLVARAMMHGRDSVHGPHRRSGGPGSRHCNPLHHRTQSRTTLHQPSHWMHLRMDPYFLGIELFDDGRA